MGRRFKFTGRRFKFTGRRFKFTGSGRRFKFTGRHFKFTGRRFTGRHLCAGRAAQPVAVRVGRAGSPTTCEPKAFMVQL